MVHVSPVSDTFEKDQNQNFQEVDIRFERVDAHFEKIDTTLGGINKQIKILTWSMGIGFTMMTAMNTFFGMLVLKLVS